VTVIDWRDRAQRWHDEQVDTDPTHDTMRSNCWCCCAGCNPHWSPGASNPYWEQAHDAMEKTPPLEDD
jgi:hypothetical protein